MYIGICDDDKKYLEKLSDKVNRILSDRYVYTINAMMPEDLLTNIKEGTLPYDILLLDIDMGECNGIDLVNEIHSEWPDCIIIFISSYIKYATRVYDVDHVYFV